MAAATFVQYNSDGIVHHASGKATGTYTAADFTITLGFTPKYVKVVNVTDRITQEWYEGMNSGDFMETAATGVRTLEIDDQLVVSTSANTFSVVAAGGAMTDNDVVVWEARG